MIQDSHVQVREKDNSMQMPGSDVGADENPELPVRRGKNSSAGADPTYLLRVTDAGKFRSRLEYRRPNRYI
jgi:hypothetical protein